MFYILLTLALFGHWALCIYAINRMHATALPHRLLKVVDLLWYVFLFAVPATVVCLVVLLGPSRAWPQSLSGRVLLLTYASICWISAPLAVLTWLRQVARTSTTLRLESNHTTRINTIRQLGFVPSGSLTTWCLSRLPTNQVFDLWIHHKTLRLARLPAQLDGLTVTHVSDLHFTGRVKQDFFRLIVDQTNALESDLIVITGDIIDKKPCFGWLSEVLGHLRARHGVFFVLGNHDLRIDDEVRLRNELVAQGFIDLGGRHETIRVNGTPILLAGNELPWFAPAADMSVVPRELSDSRPFRVAVAHSPDQFPWARTHDFDLMLAGHTHGGQIRFPFVGPVFSPSHHGVRYSAGTFYEPPTLLHVSRGLSGTRPLRFNCPPELARLILRPDAPK